MKLFTNRILEKNEVVKSHSGALPQHSGLFCLDTKKRSQTIEFISILIFQCSFIGALPQTLPPFLS
jgi:hypothetical protein